MRRDLLSPFSPFTSNNKCLWFVLKWCVGKVLRMSQPPLEHQEEFFSFTERNKTWGHFTINCKIWDQHQQRRQDCLRLCYSISIKIFSSCKFYSQITFVFVLMNLGGILCEGKAFRDLFFIAKKVSKSD